MLDRVLGTVDSVLDKFLPDADTKVEARKEIAGAVLDAESAYIKEIVSLQKQTSGITWVDGIKHLIRPLITMIMMGRLVFWWVGGPALVDNEWKLLIIVCSFYFFSRGAEKIIRKVL